MIDLPIADTVVGWLGPADLCRLKTASRSSGALVHERHWRTLCEARGWQALSSASSTQEPWYNCLRQRQVAAKRCLRDVEALLITIPAGVAPIARTSMFVPALLRLKLGGAGAQADDCAGRFVSASGAARSNCFSLRVDFGWDSAERLDAKLLFPLTAMRLAEARILASASMMGETTRGEGCDSGGRRPLPVSAVRSALEQQGWAPASQTPHFMEYNRSMSMLAAGAEDSGDDSSSSGSSSDSSSNNSGSNSGSGGGRSNAEDSDSTDSTDSNGNSGAGSTRSVAQRLREAARVIVAALEVCGLGADSADTLDLMHYRQWDAREHRHTTGARYAASNEPFQGGTGRFGQY